MTAKTESAAEDRGRLVARAGVVGAGTLVSRVLGLARDVALAALFDRAATDAWWVAFTIPNALRSLLGEGAVTSAVVPVLSAKLARDGDDAARRFFARVRGASLVALALVTVAGVLLARPLTDLFAGGYHQRPGEFERTVDLTRLVFPYIFFMGTAALGMAALNANRRFAVAAFAPALLNVALIAAAFAAPYLATGDPVQALAVGALVGGGLQVVAQWPALRRIGYAGRPAFVLDPDVREVLRRIAPLTFGIGIYYIDLVLSRRFLSELGTGAQSYFSWAMRLCDFPQGIFVMALSTAALPSLSALAARGAREELAKTWAHGMGLAMFVAIPASVALVALGEPIVVALFQRGEFDAAAAHETARALLWQGGARGRSPRYGRRCPRSTRWATRARRSSSARSICVPSSGSRSGCGGRWDTWASAWRSGDSSAVQMVLLLVGLYFRLGTIEGPTLARLTVRTLAASLLAGVAGWGAAAVLSPERASPGMMRMVPGAAGGGAFLLVYVLAAWGLRAPELDELGRLFRRRLSR